MMRSNIWFVSLGLVLGITLLAGCAQKQTAPPVNAALEGAQRLERRASVAYSKGDLLGAQKDYQTAAAVYSSLALDAPLATVQLNLAKIEGESGRAAEGLALTLRVLKAADQPQSTLDTPTRLMAHGRAAALTLALQRNLEAQQHLDAADGLCAGVCDAASTLAVLRAETYLQAGSPGQPSQANKAMASAQLALQAATTDADKANALRTRASIALAGEGAGRGSAAISAAQADAQQALALDQKLGASARVVADLALLVQIHTQGGSAVQAAHYAALHKAAVAAREQLRLK